MLLFYEINNRMPSYLRFSCLFTLTYTLVHNSFTNKPLLQVDEWWEQPAATAVDWVTVDGQNVATWLSHVKQVQMALYDQEHL